MRRAARVDVLHAPVGQLFRARGYDTLDLSRVGDGVPDWLIARGTFAFLLEVKSHNSVRHGRKDEPFTDAQLDFNARWKSARYTVDSILAAQELADLFEIRLREEAAS